MCYAAHELAYRKPIQHTAGHTTVQERGQWQVPEHVLQQLLVGQQLGHVGVERGQQLLKGGIVGGDQRVAAAP